MSEYKMPRAGTQYSYDGTTGINIVFSGWCNTKLLELQTKDDELMEKVRAAISKAEDLAYFKGQEDAKNSMIGAIKRI